MLHTGRVQCHLNDLLPWLFSASSDSLRGVSLALHARACYSASSAVLCLTYRSDTLDKYRPAYCQLVICLFKLALS